MQQPRQNKEKEGTALVIDYNDDAFGLVFLCSSFVAQDVLFSVLFVMGSAMTALLVKQGKIEFTNQVPAVVAGISFLFATLLSVTFTTPNWIPSKSDSAWQVELVVCLISIIYGYILSPMFNNNNNNKINK